MKSKSSFNKKNVMSIVICAAVLLALGLIYYIALRMGEEQTPDASYPLKVTFVDVGQGDGIVIECEGAVLVIDGGEAESAYAVTRFLKNENVDTVDCYIATHPHSDHIGAAPSILRSFDVQKVMMTAFSELNVPTTVCYEELLSAISDTSTEVLFAGAGDTCTFGPLNLEILSPAVETGDYNNMSLVIRMTYKENSFLFTGDAQTEIEQNLLDSGAGLTAQVLKVPHHGGKNATGDAFVAAVSPELAVISCGEGNDYGHPARQTLETLEKYGVQVLRTDREGSVTVYGDGKDVFVK